MFANNNKLNINYKPVVETIELLSDSDEEKHEHTTTSTTRNDNIRNGNAKPLPTLQLQTTPRLPEGSKSKGGAVPFPSWRNNLSSSSLSSSSIANQSGTRVLGAAAASVSGDSGESNLVSLSVPPKYEWDVQSANWKILSMKLKDQRNRQPTQFDHCTRSVTECNLDFEAHETFEDKKENYREVLKKEIPDPILTTTKTESETPQQQPPPPSILGTGSNIQDKSLPPPPLPPAELFNFIDGHSIELPKIEAITEEHKSGSSFIPVNTNYYPELKLKNTIEWVPTHVQFPVCHPKYCSLDVNEKETCELPDSSLSFCESSKTVTSQKDILLNIAEDPDSPWKDLAELISLGESRFFDSGVEQSSFISSTTKSPLGNSQSHDKGENERIEEECKSTKSGFEENVMIHESSPVTTELTCPVAAAITTPTTTACDQLFPANDLPSNNKDGLQIDVSHTGTIVAINEECLMDSDYNISSSIPEASISPEKSRLSEVPTHVQPSEFKLLIRCQAALARKRVMQSFKMNSSSSPLKESWGSWLRKKLHLNKVRKPVYNMTAVSDLSRVIKRRKRIRCKTPISNEYKKSSHSNQETLFQNNQSKQDSDDAAALIDEVLKRTENIEFDSTYSLHTTGCGSANDNAYVDGYGDMPVLSPQVPFVLSTFVSPSPVDYVFDKVEKCFNSAFNTSDENQDCQSIDRIDCQSTDRVSSLESHSHTGNCCDNMEEGSGSGSDASSLTSSHKNEDDQHMDQSEEVIRVNHQKIVKRRGVDSDSNSKSDPCTSDADSLTSDKDEGDHRMDQSEVVFRGSQEEIVEEEDADRNSHCTSHPSGSDANSLISNKTEDGQPRDQSPAACDGSHQESVEEEDADCDSHCKNGPRLSSVSSEVSSGSLPKTSDTFRIKSEPDDSVEAARRTFLKLPRPRAQTARNRNHGRLEKKITPRSFQILNRFLKESGDTPVPFEVASLSEETGLPTTVIYNWFKNKRESLLNNSNPFPVYKAEPPGNSVSRVVVPPMQPDEEILTITLSDSDEDDKAADKCPSSWVQSESLGTSGLANLAAIKKLDPGRLQLLFEASVDSLLEILNMQTEESSLINQLQQDTGQLQDILDSYSVFSVSQLDYLDVWLSSTIKKYKNEANEPLDEQEIEDLVDTLRPWRVVAMYAKFTKQLLNNAVKDLERMVSNVRYGWRIPVKIDKRMA